MGQPPTDAKIVHHRNQLLAKGQVSQMRLTITRAASGLAIHRASQASPVQRVPIGELMRCRDLRTFACRILADWSCFHE